MRGLKRAFLKLVSVESHIRAHIALSTFFHNRVPLAGKLVSLLLDRFILVAYGLDVKSSSVKVRALSIAHPVGILLGGNGIYSEGRVAVMAGVRFVAKSPDDPAYLESHKDQRVFVLGDNVVIGTSSVVVGPVSICSNVVIGAMSLVNRSIEEPGVYVGVPVHKIADQVSEAWVAHL